MPQNPWWAPWALFHLIEPAMREFTAQIPDLAEMKAGERILDVCCGTGGLVFQYAQTGLVATGIDIDQRVITIANNRANNASLSNVSFQAVSALEMPFDENTFDHVSIVLGLHEVDHQFRDAIISEMKRVVKNSGDLIFLDYMAPLPRAFNSWLARFTEFVAGIDHIRCFNDYVKRGGISSLLEHHHLSGKRMAELCPLEIVAARV